MEAGTEGWVYILLNKEGHSHTLGQEDICILVCKVEEVKWIFKKKEDIKCCELQTDWMADGS